MNTQSNPIAAVGRLLSLALLLAASVTASAASSWPFVKMVDPATKQPALGLTLTEYACAGGLEVTLIPMLHFAESDFYAAVDARAGHADQLIYEGVRPPGFFGAPFETDPRPDAPTDPRAITSQRLRSVATYVETFRQIHARNPESLAEVYAPLLAPGAAEAFVNHILLDYWGTPLVIKARDDGRLVIASRGADRQPGGDDFGMTLPPPPPERATPVPAKTPNELAAGLDAYEDLGRQMGLAIQAKYPMTSQTRNSSRNADVSLDMLPKFADLRTELPIEALTQITTPQRVALMYGAAHSGDLDQKLRAGVLKCRVSQTETLVVLRANGPNAARRSQTIDEILGAFAQSPN